MNNNLAYQEETWQELINGHIVLMSPRPAFEHVSTAGNIYNIFFNYLKGKKCVAIPDGCDLFLTQKDHFIPDMMVVCDPDKIRHDGVYGAPDLVVEVLSSSTAKRDRGYKKDVYEQCGVKEYWLVDTANKSVEQYLLNNSKFVLHEVYAIHPDYMLNKMSEEEKNALITEFKCSLYDDLLISLDDIFYRII